MPSTPDPRILDLYKLAVEMADRVTARRAGANAFFVTIQSSVIAALGFLSASAPVPRDRYLVALCVAGTAASAIWFLLLRSYRDLNSAKFKVIDQLEDELPIAIFREEWTYLKVDPVRRWRKSYAELGTIERWAPGLFALINLTLAISVVAP